MTGQSFTFRKSSIQGDETWTLAGGELRGPNSVKIDLSTVTGGDFIDLDAQHGIKNSALRLDHARDKTEITCASKAFASQRRAHLDLCAAVIGELAHIEPRARFTINGDRQLIWMFFAIGLCMLLGAPWAAYGAWSYRDGAPGDEFEVLLLAAALLLGIGGYICHKYWPWRTPEWKTPTEVLEFIRSLED
ncbi:MAG: hypothetical protein ACR2PA_06030 [Hyphomicrobiaceae bacterium]